MTETPTPKDVVRRFLDHGWDRAARRWDLDVIAECFDVDGYWSHTWQGNLVDTGRVQGAFFSHFSPDRRYVADDLIAEGDLVVHRSVFRTTVDGEVLGVTADNRPVEVVHIEMWRVTDGKIVEHWGGLGEAQHLYRQLVGDDDRDGSDSTDDGRPRPGG